MGAHLNNAFYEQPVPLGIHHEEYFPDRLLPQDVLDSHRIDFDKGDQVQILTESNLCSAHRIIGALELHDRQP